MASSKNRSFFRRDDPFFTLQMVNFSFQHDEGRLNDALHQFHSIELVNALRMGVSCCIRSHFYFELFRYLISRRSPYSWRVWTSTRLSEVSTRRRRLDHATATNVINDDDERLFFSYAAAVISSSSCPWRRTTKTGATSSLVFFVVVAVIIIARGRGGILLPY